MRSQQLHRQSLRVGWLIPAILASVALSTQPATAQDERVVPEMKPRARVPIYDPGAPVQRKVLKNGVILLVQEQRTSERVAGAVALRMGAYYESIDEAGRSQVLIKTITAGTEKYPPAELALRILAANARLEGGAGPDLGQIAISTTRERADQAVDLLAEVALHPSFPDTAVEATRQRALTTAAEEQESPLKAAYSAFLAAMYRGSPFERPIAGTVSGIADCRRRDVVALYKKYFVGGNMVVCFVGNFDGKKVLERLEKAFSLAPRGEPPQPAQGVPIPLAADTTITSERDIFATVLAFGYPAPGYEDPDHAAFKIIESYLGSADRSPITFWLPQSGLATAVGVIYAPYPKRSSIAVYLGAKPQDAAAARDSVQTVMTRLKTQPLDEGEWNTQLKRVQNGTFASQNDPLVRARSMSQFEVAGVGYDYLRRFEETLLGLSPESVRAAAERWLTHSVEATITPVKGESKL